MRRDPLYISTDAGVPAVGPPAPAGDPFTAQMLRVFGSGGFGLRQPLGAGGYGRHIGVIAFAPRARLLTPRC